MNDLKNIIKKTQELCEERLQNNVLLIEGKVSLCASVDFLKAGLPVKRFYDVTKMQLWELLRPPTDPGVYVFEGVDKLSTAVANSLYGWALQGKNNGIRVAFVAEKFPQSVLNSAQKITL
jgi:hypothetical protein